MKTKKVINIINFIRAEDPRVEQQMLYDTFKNQIELCREYPMPYTFLMQYDAIARPEYVKLLKDNEDDKNMEIGVWIELAREQIEKVGLTWNGLPDRKWDWRVNPGMLMAYTLPQRKILIDELFERFKAAFGYYPESAGSWLLDSYSIRYMAEKYNVKAFCICKEQFGTDGYTLWGGYCNQGYFPSKKNMFVPAQTIEEQIHVPVFRMLGVDPIYQYDFGIDEHYNPAPLQHVLTLEPSWQCGQNPDWVEWYLHNNMEEEAISFSYTQAGQENPFMWPVFGEALKMQMAKIYDGVKAKRWEVLTLRDTGKWFTERYQMTPATSMTALTDWKNEGRQSVWFDSKRYRLNLYTQNDSVCIRDIFLFDENHPERYWEHPVEGGSAIYDALPIIDGYRWGGNDVHAAWYFTRPETGEKAQAQIFNVFSENENELTVQLKVDGEPVTFRCFENGFRIEFLKTLFGLSFRYFSLADTEITAVDRQSVIYRHDHAEYGMRATGGYFAENNGFDLIANEKTVEIAFFS